MFFYCKRCISFYFMEWTAFFFIKPLLPNSHFLNGFDDENRENKVILKCPRAVQFSSLWKLYNQKYNKMCENIRLIKNSVKKLWKIKKQCDCVIYFIRVSLFTNAYTYSWLIVMHCVCIFFTRNRWFIKLSSVTGKTLKK